MLEKTMKQIITKKVNEWKDSIDDEEVKKVIDKDLIITGGCFTSMIQNEEPKDFDCYFRTKESVIKLSEYYINNWNSNNQRQVSLEVFDDTPEVPFVDRNRVKILIPSAGVAGNPENANGSEELGVDSVNETIEELTDEKVEETVEKEKKKYFPVFFSSNAITLSNGIQIVVRFFGEPSEIHETYDFEHTKAYWDNGSKTLEIPKSVYEMVVNKTLRYTGSRYPVASLFRLRKFLSRGWKINVGQITKIAFQISELDLNDISVLTDQLIGADSLYMMNLIDQLQKKKENDADFELTSNYVISIIDKIF